MVAESLLCIAVGIQILYYGFLLYKILAFQEYAKVGNNHNKEASVIICARNEALNLLRNLPKILEQDYPYFEVVVVNDASEDNTLNVLEDFKKKYTNLQIVNILPAKKSTVGKKAALQLGIESAKNPYLVLTDADCYPQNNRWLNKIMSGFSEKNELVLGVSPYENTGTFLSHIVQYETVTTMLQYVGYALWGNSYMGVGRNIAYTRSLYERAGGFENHIDTASGDDDLFVQQAATHTQVSVRLSQYSQMVSMPPKTFCEWWKQKTRHYTTGASYRPSHQFLLGTFLLTKAVIYVLAFYLILYKKMTFEALMLYLVYFSILIIALGIFTKKYHLSFRAFKAVPFDFIYTVTVLIQGFVSKFSSKNRW